MRRLCLCYAVRGKMMVLNVLADDYAQLVKSLIAEDYVLVYRREGRWILEKAWGQDSGYYPIPVSGQIENLGPWRELKEENEGN